MSTNLSSTPPKTGSTTTILTMPISDLMKDAYWLSKEQQSRLALKKQFRGMDIPKNDAIFFSSKGEKIELKLAGCKGEKVRMRWGQKKTKLSFEIFWNGVSRRYQRSMPLAMGRYKRSLIAWGRLKNLIKRIKQQEPYLNTDLDALELQTEKAVEAGKTEGVNAMITSVKACNLAIAHVVRSFGYAESPTTSYDVNETVEKACADLVGLINSITMEELRCPSVNQGNVASALSTLENFPSFSKLDEGAQNGIERLKNSLAMLEKVLHKSRKSQQA